MGNILVSLVNSTLDRCHVQGENRPYARLIWYTLREPWSYRPCSEPLLLKTSETQDRECPLSSEVSVLSDGRQADKK